jgi:hypothetical protein
VQLPASIQERRFALEITLLLQGAMLIFLFTVSIGILNGTDLVDFDQKIILAHVHTGTLGWLTLCVFACALWLFGEGEMSRGLESHARITSYVAIATFLLFNFAFATTYDEFRPFAGTLAGTAIVAFLAWVVIRAGQVDLTTPHVGVLVAVATSVVGAVVGVLLCMRLATGDEWIPKGGEDAHPATMVVGFLVPVAMALGEWALTWPRPAPVTRLGVVQMSFPFVGGLMLLVGLLWEIDPLVQMSLPVEMVGILIYLFRMRRELLGALAPGAPWQARFAAASPPYLFVVIALFIYLIGKYEGDADLIPTHKIVAIDHLTFIGAMTNAIFALLLAITGERLRRWPWLPPLIFVGVNVGLVLFVLGLYHDTATLKQIGTPLLGAALLGGLATFTYAIFAGAADEEPRGVARTEANG